MRFCIAVLFVQLLKFSRADGQEVTSLKNDDYLIYWSCGGRAIRDHYKIFYLDNLHFGVDISHKKCVTAPKFLNDIFILKADLSLKTLDDDYFMYAKALVIANETPTELLTEKGLIKCSKTVIDAPTTSVVAYIDGKMYYWVFMANINECSPLISKMILDIRKTIFFNP